MNAANSLIFFPQSTRASELFELVQRRHDLTQMLVAEKTVDKRLLSITFKHTLDVTIKTIYEKIQ